MRVKIVKVSLLSVAVAACLLWTCFTCGCQFGDSPLWSQANPKTKMGFKPLSAEFHYEDTAGKTIAADQIEAEYEGKGVKGKFKAQGLSTEDRSVENRAANVGQLEQANAITKTVGDTVVGSLSLAGDIFRAAKESDEVAMEREAPSVWRSPWLIPAFLVAFLAFVFRNTRLLNPKD